MNYSYSVTLLEETKMQCFSETAIQIWDFECETVLLNSGFARSCKVSRFVSIWLLPWIFWNNSLIFFFFLSTSGYLWWMGFFCLWVSEVLRLLSSLLSWKQFDGRPCWQVRSCFMVDLLCLDFPVLCAVLCE